MRILQLITLSELGGAQSVVVNLANYLCKNNEVIVAAGEGDGKMWQLLSPKIKKEHVKCLKQKISPADDIKAFFELKALYKKYKPDIIHLHSSKAGLLGRLAFPKDKIIYTVHGFDSIRLAHRKFLPLERLFQHRCKVIVGVSKYDERNLLSEGITNNVSTVYNGIYPPEKLGEDPFRGYGYDKRILCIARISPQKNLELYIKIAELLPEYAFFWIGNQTEIKSVHPENLYFLGNIPDAGSYIRYADLFMLTSNYEGLPMVIIEALACSCPVIASDVGGISELLNGSNGYAVKNDPARMAELVDQTLKLPKDRIENMSTAAYATYTDSFTVEHMSRGYLDIYNKIISI